MVISLAFGWEIIQGNNALPMMYDEPPVSSTAPSICPMLPTSASQFQDASTVPPINCLSTSQPDSPFPFRVGPTPSGVMTLLNRYLVKACDSSCRKTTVRIRLYRATGKREAGLILAYEISGNLTLAYPIETRTHYFCLSNQVVVDTNLIRGVVTLWYSSP